MKINIGTQQLMLVRNVKNGTLLKSCTILSTVLILTSCANMKGAAYNAAKNDQQIFSQPLRDAKAPAKSEGDEHASGKESGEQGLEVLRTPTLSVEQAEIQARENVIPTLKEKQVSRLTFNNMPVGSFINEIFGNQLGVNYIVEPSVRKTPDLVTMRITNPVSQKDLYNLATQTLRSYGVTTSLKDNVLIFDFSETAANGEVPLLISGRTLPEVPTSSRPIFHIYPLTSVSTTSVRSWLGQMFPRKELDIKEDIDRNALVFVGAPRVVSQALAAAELLDRPAMQGMYSRILRPSLSTVTDLADNLQRVLTSEGYLVRMDAGKSAIRLLPLETVGQLVIFAKSQEVLSHIIQWAKTLETEQHNTVEKGLFSYQVQSTQATHIVEVLNSLGVANFQSSESDSATPGNSTNSSRASGNSQSRSDATGKFAVDAQLNTILFSGSGKNWLQLLPIIKKLDKPAPSVMVEVIIAEVQLNDSENTGIEWLANSTLGGFDLDFGTIGGLGLGGAGFSLNLDSAGSTRAILNAFYKNEKANIRSRPRIMVKSGGDASIDVGNEIPIITSNSQSTDGANAPVIQNISYRKTGVLLKIKPTVHATGYVDIEIEQELSEAASSSSSNIDSPTILNRKISTTVTLRDGGSVLLGGLISSTTSIGEQGVPLLGRLPLLGKLFSTDTDTQNRTELMVMIIPYVLDSPEEAEKLTDELQRSRIETLSADIVPQENN